MTKPTINTIYGSTIDISRLIGDDGSVRLKVIAEDGDTLANKHLNRKNVHELIRQLTAIAGEPPKVPANLTAFDALKLGDLFHFSDSSYTTYIKTSNTEYLRLGGSSIMNAKTNAHMSANVSYRLLPGTAKHTEL